jgi:hypothetical protein
MTKAQLWPLSVAPGQYIVPAAEPGDRQAGQALGPSFARPPAEPSAAPGYPKRKRAVPWGRPLSQMGQTVSQTGQGQPVPWGPPLSARNFFALSAQSLRRRGGDG